MPLRRLLAPSAFVVLTSVFGAGCMDQYRPERYIAQENAEREMAARPVAKLTETGELPSGGAAAVPVEQRYAELCASCHGAAGGGDGPAGVALNPKPRNFRDKAWQSSTSDDHIYAVIKDGGPAVGLSPMMAPWGSVLKEDELQAMVAYVRALQN